MLAGIDYGLGQVNRDHDTGIHYGVIPVHSILQAWEDTSEEDYGSPTCPECGQPVVDYDPDLHDGYRGLDGFRNYLPSSPDHACPSCKLELYDDEVWPEDPLSWNYNDEGYSMEQGGDDIDVFVVKSPYFTYCALCSPCAPGAGYILDQLSPEEGIKAYCPGPDWWDDDDSSDIAIYSVVTGERVA